MQVPVVIHQSIEFVETPVPPPADAAAAMARALHQPEVRALCDDTGLPPGVLIPMLEQRAWDFTAVRAVVDANDALAVAMMRAEIERQMQDVTK